MKTGTVLFLAVVMPFGSLLLVGMLLQRLHATYRLKRAVVPAR